MDFIYQDESLVVKPGGLYYTIVGLVNIVDEKDRIYPVTLIGEKYKEHLITLYKKTKGEFIGFVQEIPEVHLKIKNIGEREERYKNLTDKLNIDNLIQSDLNLSGILINMVSGYDITPDDIVKIRNKFDCPIYIDIHTLSRGLDEKGGRTFRAIPQISEWLKYVDIVQANEYELETICQFKDELSKVEFILSSGPKIVIITKGERGAVLYSGGNELLRIAVMADKLAGKNKVGCGDIFGAAFFYSYICGNSIYDTLRFANTAAGTITNYYGFDEYKNLKDDIGKRFY